jgi:hypothetical protein
VCWHSWFGFHHAGYPDLVRSSAKAAIYTARVVICACLDHTISPNGDIGILSMAHWSENRQTRTALIVFLVQPIINALWSIAFFGLESPLYGLIVIIALWITIVLTIIKFFRISTIAAALLVPYILWVSFATVLNGSILVLNP